MHKNSKERIQELANQLAAAASIEDTSLLLQKARELYESITILHHTSNAESEEVTTSVDNSTDSSDTQENQKIKTSEEKLSVQERIQHIVDTAPDFKPVKKTISPVEIEVPKKEVTPIKEAEKDDLPTPNLDDEFKDAISADYAADLFESAEKIEISKKSLNDQLSQKEIQIGLNDRIAFVKHLFKGSQSDFTRVLSQLNSFETESHAKQFIDTVVKPDFNWEEKIEYEERFISLIERKFL